MAGKLAGKMAGFMALENGGKKKLAGLIQAMAWMVTMQPTQRLQTVQGLSQMYSIFSNKLQLLSQPALIKLSNPFSHNAILWVQQLRRSPDHGEVFPDILRRPA